MEINNNRRKYVFFNRSGAGSVTAFYSPTASTPSGTDSCDAADHVKLTATVALEKGRTSRHPSSGECSSDVFSGASSDEDSDAQSRPPAAAGGDQCDCEELMSEDGVRGKLEILARLVGVDGGNPAAVLAEVVRVIKALDAKKNEDFRASHSCDLEF